MSGRRFPVLVGVAGLGLVSLLAASCGNNATRLRTDSVQPVLVPRDPKFLDQWFFTLDEAPDNYTARAHFATTFDPDIDRTLGVESYQIGDDQAWTGEVPSEDAKTRDALVAVLADSVTLTTGGPCAPAVVDPMIVSCRYDVDRADALTVLVRRFDLSGTIVTMLVLGDDSAARDYISGQFVATPVADADEWFRVL